MFQQKHRDGLQPAVPLLEAASTSTDGKVKISLWIHQIHPFHRNHGGNNVHIQIRHDFHRSKLISHSKVQKYNLYFQLYEFNLGPELLLQRHLFHFNLNHSRAKGFRTTFKVKWQQWCHEKNGLRVLCTTAARCLSKGDFFFFTCQCFPKLKAFHWARKRLKLLTL